MLETFFNPKSITVIGASHTPGKIGYEIFKNLMYGFKEKVYPVNPNTEPILNKKVYPSVKKIPDRIDLAVIVVPAALVPKVLKECVRKRVKSVIIISGGFSEIGREGKKLEEECKKIIKNTETRVIGPNCLGVYDTYSKVDTLFLPRERLKKPDVGNIAFISQSGAVGSTILDWLAEEGVGISKFISYGIAMDVNECDLLEYLGNDRKTKVITMFLEGVRDGKRFIEVAKKVSRKKPIVVLKGGRTEAGSKAVASHTASLAGSSEIYSGIFKQTGIIEANNWQELFDFAKTLSQPLPKGNRVAIITNGGGFGVLAADECEKQGLKLPEPNKKIKNKLRKIVPSYVILRNPIDLSGDTNAKRYEVAIEECLRSRDFDGVIAIVLLQVPTLERKIIDIIISLSKKYNKPLLCCTAGSEFTRTLSKILETKGIPVFPTPERSVKSFKALLSYSKWLKR